MKKELIFTDHYSLADRKLQVEKELTALNNFICQLNTIMPNIPITQSLIHSLVSPGGMVDFGLLNKLVFDSMLLDNPQLAALRLPDHKIKLLLDVPEYSKKDFINSMPTDLIHNFKDWWAINNSIAVLKSGLNEHLKALYSYYAEDQIQIDRLEQCKIILSAIHKLQSLAPDPASFSCLNMPLLLSRDGELMPDPNVVINGHEFNRRDISL